jgi:hypothetical protein
MPEKKKEIQEFVQIPVEWITDEEEIESVYVNHLQVTHGGPEFYIYFGELPWPAKLDPKNPPDKLEIYTRVRIVISPDQMGDMLEALKTNYENYLKKKEEEEK